MKVCVKCKTESDDYRKLSKNIDGLDTWCKPCRRAADKVTHNKNIDKNRADTLRRKNISRARNHEYLYSYLLEHPCVDCNEPDPIVLEFDHQRDKHKGVGQMISDGCSIEALDREIAKCEVRCANCHRRKTARDFNYFKHSKVAKLVNVTSS